MKLFLYFLLIICFYFHTAKSLRCYECTSENNNQNCFTPLDTTVVKPKECSAFSGGISRMIYPLNLTENYQQIRSDGYQCYFFESYYPKTNENQIFRGCIKNNPNFCEQLTTAGNVQNFEVRQCKTCEWDNCNSSQKILPGMFLVLIFLFASKIQRNV